MVRSCLGAPPGLAGIRRDRLMAMASVGRRALLGAILAAAALFGGVGPGHADPSAIRGVRADGHEAQAVLAVDRLDGKPSPARLRSADARDHRSSGASTAATSHCDGRVAPPVAVVAARASVHRSHLVSRHAPPRGPPTLR